MQKKICIIYASTAFLKTIFFHVLYISFSVFQQVLTSKFYLTGILEQQLHVD